MHKDLSYQVEDVKIQPLGRKNGVKLGTRTGVCHLIGGILSGVIPALYQE
jgi:hypothetical protein